MGEEFCNEIKSSIGPQIGLISKEISDNFLHYQQTVTAKTGQQIDDSIQEKYIYFNHRNYRFHACFYHNNENAISNREGKRNTQLSGSVMNLLCDLYSQEHDDDSNALINSDRESIIKTANGEYWIVRRNYNYRSFYLILHKSTTLIDIADEAKKLLGEIIKNVFIMSD